VSLQNCPLTAEFFLQLPLCSNQLDVVEKKVGSCLPAPLYHNQTAATTANKMMCKLYYTSKEICYSARQQE
jgi:hypothetical protein